MSHIPVLLNEVIEVLNPQPKEFFIDGTINGGGHAKEIIKRISPSGTLLGIDLDGDLIERAEKKLKSDSPIFSLLMKQGNYAAIPEILKELALGPCDGLLLDLGFSSYHLDESGRGFSFTKDEPLDMRYDKSVGEPASFVINRFSERDLADLIWRYGEERNSRKIAKVIVTARRKKPIESAADLKNIIEKILPRNRIHPATKTFQTLRIFVNRELDNLEKILSVLPSIVNHNGRVAVISFHSLEDRIIKNSFKKLFQSKLAEPVNKKVIRPKRAEIINNPKSRSAKLRSLIIS